MRYRAAQLSITNHYAYDNAKTQGAFDMESKKERVLFWAFTAFTHFKHMQSNPLRCMYYNIAYTPTPNIRPPVKRAQKLITDILCLKWLAHAVRTARQTYGTREQRAVHDDNDAHALRMEKPKNTHSPTKQPPNTTIVIPHTVATSHTNAHAACSENN